nr:transposase [Vibrio coralliilyticus]
MTRKRRNHSPEFQARVALAAAKGDKTVVELAQKYNLHANQTSTWKKELLEKQRLLPELLHVNTHSENAGKATGYHGKILCLGCKFNLHTINFFQCGQEVSKTIIDNCQSACVMM